MTDFKNARTCRRAETTILCAIVPIFVLTFIAFVLLALTTFSLPFVHSLYFLRISQAGGIRFGIWGWCLDEGVCSDTLALGYTWEPQIAIPITKALALYPVAAVSVFTMLITLLPVMRDRGPRTLRVFAVFAWFSFVVALLAFVFMIAMWAIADERFRKAGWEVRWGPLPWMSFVATMLLFIVALNTWKGILSTSYLATDPTFSGEEWEATTQDKVRPPQERDLEKAVPASPSSTLPATPSTNEAAQQSASSTEDHKPLVNVALHSPKEEQGEDRGRTKRWSHRQRHDSFRGSKIERSRSGRSQPSGVPFPLAADIPRPSRPLRQTSQKKHHSQLTPLRTT